MKTLALVMASPGVVFAALILVGCVLTVAPFALMLGAPLALARRLTRPRSLPV